VLLNSVVQYFPDVDYLRVVLGEAVRVARPGGHIVVGDVRSLPLLTAFHTSVQLQRAAAGTDAPPLRARVQHAVRQDKELVLDPEFFAAFVRESPRLGRLEMTPKTGDYDNELSRFRYDVVMTVGTKAEVAEPDDWLAWDPEGRWVESLTA